MKRMLIALCLFSTVAHAKLSTGSMGKSIPADAMTLSLSGSLGSEHVQISPLATAKKVTILLNLVGESDKKIQQFKEQWALKVSGKYNVDAFLEAQERGASRYCEELSIYFSSHKLKGVCVKSLVLVTPPSIKAEIGRDGVITFNKQ